MKTMRWAKWAVLIILFFCVTTTEAAFGVFKKHYLYGRSRSWTMRYKNRNYSYWYITVPANAATLKITTGLDGHRGYGDCDLYVGYGFVPYTGGRRYTYRRRSNNYREVMTIRNPRAGRWYIRLRGYSYYRTCLRLACSRKTTTTTTTTTTYNWRTDMLNRVNSYRRQYGRTALSQQSQLQRAAQNYASDMAIKRYYGGADHHGSTSANWTMARRITAAGYNWNSIRENIAYGYTTVARVMAAWWASTGHRNNILATDVTQVGFGYYYGSDNYGRRWVQDFGRPR